MASASACLALMKRYCIDYVNVGDQSVTRDLMIEDYVLQMGEYEVVGRDGAYWDATARQMKQYPGLLLTVHEIATCGNRLMMRFTEHGRHAKSGVPCAWGGISMYRWDGSRLTHCSVEQDYWSRKRQIDAGRADTVDHPATAPFTGEGQQPDPAAEKSARKWLEAGGIGTDGAGQCDDEWLPGHERMRVLDQRSIAIHDLFAVGQRVAFHATIDGTIAADFPAGETGAPGALHVAGILHIDQGKIAHGRVIRNRMNLRQSAG